MIFAKKQQKRIGYLLPQDARFISSFYLKEAKRLQNGLNKTKNLVQLSEIGKTAFYLQYCNEDMTFCGYDETRKYIERDLKRKFGTDQIFVQIYKKVISKIIEQTNGLLDTGENIFLIQDGQVYYRDFFSIWHSVNSEDLFLLLPRLSMIQNNLAAKLEQVFKNLNVNQRSINPEVFTKKNDCQLENHLLFVEGITTPEEYFTLSAKQINEIIKEDFNVADITYHSHQNPQWIETRLKLALEVLQFADTLNDPDTHYLYLLRDGLLFAEARKILDIIQNKDISGDQILISRTVLSKNNQLEYYWNLICDPLYVALKKKPKTFDQFYSIYYKAMEKVEKSNPDILDVFQILVDYIKPKVIPHLNQRKKIKIIDTGFQGSINMLTKYLIDKYIIGKKSNEVDILLHVTCEWLKNIYTNRYESDYFPFMRDVENLIRSDSLYFYEPDSINTGSVKVKMGTKENQQLANYELWCTVVVAKNLSNLKGTQDE